MKYRYVIAAVVGALVGGPLGLTLSWTLALASMSIPPFQQDTPPHFIFYGFPLGLVLGPALAIVMTRARSRRRSIARGAQSSGSGTSGQKR